MANPVHGARIHALRSGLVVSLALAAGACAVASPFAVQSTGSLSAVSAVAMPAEASAGGERAQLHTSLLRAFADRSVSVSADGRYLAEYSVSVRDAEGGLTTATSPVRSEDEIDWKAQPRDAKLFDGCTAQRMRATLVLMDRQTGTMAYRGEGEATACQFSGDDIAEVARQLVRDAVGR